MEADFNDIADKSLQEYRTQSAIRAKEQEDEESIIQTPAVRPGGPTERGAAPFVPKPKSKARQESSTLKDKTTCPDCGKQITIHALKYTHKRYCKATTKK